MRKWKRTVLAKWGKDKPGMYPPPPRIDPKLYYADERAKRHGYIWESLNLGDYLYGPDTTSM